MAFRSAQVLIRDRRWLMALGAETAGWSCTWPPCGSFRSRWCRGGERASGVGVLAFATARGRPSRLARRERVAVVLAVAGLTLLAFSLAGTAESDHHPAWPHHHLWLAARGGAAAPLITTPTRLGRAASPGLGAGLARTAISTAGRRFGLTGGHRGQDRDLMPGPAAGGQQHMTSKTGATWRSE